MSLSPFSSLAKRVYRRIPRGWSACLDLYQTRRHGGARLPARLDVMTSVGGHDADVLQVMLLSLSDSHPEDRIEFWLFHLHLDSRTLATLSVFCDGLKNLTLNIVHITGTQYFALLSKLGGRPFGARFLWLVAHDYLPAEVTRIIYLDPLDTLVMGDLLPFLNQPFLGRSLVACREFPGLPPMIQGPARLARGRAASPDRILRISRGIINSGSIVLNLDRLRRKGITIAAYLDVAQWAHDPMGLPFGDQGLFSLTHGSDYVQAHDRYNFRFHDVSRHDRRMRAAVIHFAGRIPKPYHWRLTPDQEQQVLTHLARKGMTALPLNPHQSVTPYDLGFYRLWWGVCARTPVYDRIAPLAADYTAGVLTEQQVGA